MKTRLRKSGSVFLIAVFVVALLAVLVTGILQMVTEEIQLMRNQIYAAEALATAEAGLNDAFARIRADDEWLGPLTDVSFNGGSYDVTVTGNLPTRTIVAEGTSSQGFAARLQADITIDTNGDSDHTIRIDHLRINE
jgi:Tfp pilus assembly protein PilX